MRRIIYFVLLIGLLVWRYMSALPVFDEEYIGTYRGLFLVIEGKITDLEGPFFEIAVSRATQGNRWFKVRGNIRVKKSGFLEVSYGDLIEVKGVLQNSLREDPRIAGVINMARVKIVRSAGFSFFGLLYRFREKLMQRFGSIFPEPSASLASGLLLGARTDIPRPILDDFRKTGLTHILAISGYNIILVINVIFWMFSGFPRRLSTVLSIDSVIIFTCLVGASASVVRAAIMGSLGLLARFFGRPARGMRLLFVAVFLMVIYDPFIVFYDVGFQLSFGATAGMILFSAYFQKFLEFLPARFGLRESLAGTWAAQVFTFPIIFFSFGSFSLVATLANIMVAPLIPFLMLGSFLSLIFGILVALPTSLLFDGMLRIIHVLASLPGAFIEVGIS